MSRVKDLLAGTGYWLGWKAICHLPESWVRWAFTTVTDIAWRRQGHGVQVLECNLLRVLGPGTGGKELRAASRAGMRSYGRYWMEVFRLPAVSKERILRDMQVNEDADQALTDAANGKGIIFALPHMGNWEVAGAYVAARGIKLATVAERLKPESVFDMFVAFRESLGMEVLPLGGTNVFGVLAQRLRAGHLVCLVCDRDLTESGVEVDFFGEKARMAAGPAALAVQTGASLRAATLWFTEVGWFAHVTPDIPVPAEGNRREKAAAMTQQLAQAFEKGIAEHPQDWHMLQRVFLSDLDPARLARLPASRLRGRLMKIGMVCPYTWDVPGGVQQHIRDLTEALIELGHTVSVISPADEDTPLPDYVVPAGRAVPVPYNGSVARLAFGFLSASRVRRWVKEGHFDVLHVHEPAAPSLSLLACWVAAGPIVATMHTANPKSRVMHAASPALQSALEKINGRIAVSEAARTTLVEHLGGDAVLIPNGVATRRYTVAEPLPGWPGDGGAIGFLGRMDETRKGLAVLLKAFETLGTERAGLRLLIAGPGDAGEVLERVPAALRDRVVLLGQVSEQDKVRMLHSVDVFCAPNTGGESFGIVLAEAMAAGAPIVASDLDAFRRVLRGGRAGELFTPGDPADLARAAGLLLDDPGRRAALSAAAISAVRAYDWTVVARAVLHVYETVVLGTIAVAVAH